MTKRIKTLAMIGAATALACAPVVAAAQDVSPKVARGVQAAVDDAAGGTPQGAADAINALTGLLAAPDLPPYEKALILRVRGTVRARAGSGEVDAAIADLDGAIQTGTMAADEANEVRQGIVGIYIRAERVGDALAYVEANAADWGGLPGRRDVLTAMLSFAAQDTAKAEAEAARAAAILGPTPEVRALRYTLLLMTERADEAKAELARLREAAPYSDAARVALAGHDSLVASDPPPRALLAHARALKDGLVAEDAAYQPVKRVNPGGFERCLGDGRAVHTVLLVYDVTGKGRTDDVRVASSTNDCFDRHAVRAVKKWRYAPTVVAGEPYRREDVKTFIKFQVGY